MPGRPKKANRSLRFLAPAALAALMLVAFTWPSAASASRQSAVGLNAKGTKVRATVETTSDYGDPNYGYPGEIEIMIQRDGGYYVDQFIDRPPGCGDCERVYAQGVRVTDMGGSREPEIIFSFYSGGAHCCTSWRIFYWQNGRYHATTHIWGNPQGPRRFYWAPRGLLMPASDDRFAYAFDSFAESEYPVQVWRFKHNRMVDVTRKHPNFVRKDLKIQARKWHRRARRGSAAGPLAAWVADMCSLNKCRQSFRVAGGAVRRGAVSKSIYGNSLRPFMRKMKRKLRRWGYIRG
ncbi:MAG: hypothetical protein K1X67_15960 [Fimbriimonadaceae bacterium]|nr:hypothetical protein [Fimbriimonadaceae bacterium]